MRKFFSLFAALTLSVGLWAETVSYRYPEYKTNGDVTSGIKEWKTTTADATEITNSTTTLTEGWYVVKGEVEVQAGALTCNGAVHLILADNASLTISGYDKEKDSYNPGIRVSGTNNSLTIYAQSTGEQMGYLYAEGDWRGPVAGIGGGDGEDGSNITINGGTLEIYGYGGGAAIGGGKNGNGSNLTINGGEIYVEMSDDAASIGGGMNGDGSNITINGGVIQTYGGIGGGEYGDGSYITINGGEILSAAISECAGIGGGKDSNGSYITINGGDVTVYGGAQGAGIGGGCYYGQGGAGSYIVINGGVINVLGGEGAAGIGGGKNGDGSYITINGGEVITTSAAVGAGIGGGADGNGLNISINGGTVTANGGIGGSDYSNGDAIGKGGNSGTTTVASGILVDIKCTIKAGDSEEHTDVIENDGNDLASKLEGKQYATIVSPVGPTPVPSTYTRNNLSDGKWGTICLGYAVPSLEDVTATFYKLNYYDGANSLYVTEVTELEAGKPYVFEAKAESFTVEYIPTDEPTPAETVNGLIGTLDGLTMEADAYALVNNMVVKAAAGTTVPANRAYIDLMQVSTEPIVAAGAPRRIGVASAPTGFELNNVQKKACKVFDKGQFVIIRDNKRFNAQGIEIQ